MRIRKDIEKWNLKRFLKLFFALAVLYNLFILFAGYLDGEGPLHSSERTLFWALNGALMPLILSSSISFASRNATLYINDFQNIPDFQGKLLHHISKSGFHIHQQSATEIYFRPSSWFYKLLKSWFGTENLYLKGWDEVILTGTLKKISDIEDTLTWSSDFKM